MSFFGRDIRVVAGPLTIEPRTEVGATGQNLKMRFDITKTLKRDSNSAALSIWNLKRENRAKLQEKGLEVIIDAGYVDEIVQTFKGNVEQTTTGRDSVNWITQLELDDGGLKLKNSRINQSFRGPQTPGQMLKKAAEALGLDAGNLDEKVAQDGARSVLKEFVQNVILSGKAADVLDELAASLGVPFSVQDGQLQFLAPCEALKDPALTLDLANGLIGSPEVGEKGIVTAKSLLNGRYKPGRKVDLSSLVVEGSFVVQKVQHVADTWGAEWESNLELKPL